MDVTVRIIYSSMKLELIYVKDFERTLFRISLLLKLSQESEMIATLVIVDNSVGEKFLSNLMLNRKKSTQERLSVQQNLASKR